MELASLVRYEHMQAASGESSVCGGDGKAGRRTIASVRTPTSRSLTCRGRPGICENLRGKVVLVNFWATWCPPCRKEMPDLDTLYNKFKDQGFVVLAISDEEAAKVSPFITERKISYPVLLDPGRKVNDAFIVEGIPKSFVYDRNGKMVAQSIDMRTRNQFLEMLAQAGLQ